MCQFCFEQTSPNLKCPPAALTLVLPDGDRVRDALQSSGGVRGEIRRTLRSPPAKLLSTEAIESSVSYELAVFHRSSLGNVRERASRPWPRCKQERWWARNPKCRTHKKKTQQRETAHGKPSLQNECRTLITRQNKSRLCKKRS